MPERERNTRLIGHTLHRDKAALIHEIRTRVSRKNLDEAYSGMLSEPGRESRGGFRRSNPGGQDRENQSKGMIEAEISEALIKFEKEYMGRGPVETRTYIIDDMIIVRLKGVLRARKRSLQKRRRAGAHQEGPHQAARGGTTAPGDPPARYNGLRPPEHAYRHQHRNGRAHRRIHNELRHGR